MYGTLLIVRPFYVVTVCATFHTPINWGFHLQALVFLKKPVRPYTLEIQEIRKPGGKSTFLSQEKR